jgi:hypothetical protein
VEIGERKKCVGYAGDETEESNNVQALESRKLFKVEFGCNNHGLIYIWRRVAIQPVRPSFKAAYTGAKASH